MLDVYEGFFGMMNINMTKAYEAPDLDSEPVMEDDIEAENQRVAAAGDAAEAAAFGEPVMEGDEPDLDSEPMMEDDEESVMEDEPVMEDDVDDPVDTEDELPEISGGAVDGVDDPTASEELPPEDPSATEDPMIEYDKKKNVHKNTLQLLSIVTVSRDAFEQKFGSKIEGEQFNDYHKIMNGFNDLIDIMNDTLTNKFANGEYKTLIRYYVSMVKVYDILTKMTDNFVNDYIKENEETNS